MNWKLKKKNAVISVDAYHTYHSALQEMKKGKPAKAHKDQNLPATCSVAFLLRAIPQSFSASHQYTPASLSLLECTTCNQWINEDKMNENQQKIEEKKKIVIKYTDIQCKCQ